jgi:hypothetical protein
MNIIENPALDKFRVLSIAKLDTVVSTFCLNCLGNI